jgi:hypothetical protein
MFWRGRSPRSSAARSPNHASSDSKDSSSGGRYTKCSWSRASQIFLYHRSWRSVSASYCIAGGVCSDEGICGAIVVLGGGVRRYKEVRLGLTRVWLVESGENLSEQSHVRMKLTRSNRTKPGQTVGSKPRDKRSQPISNINAS